MFIGGEALAVVPGERETLRRPFKEGAMADQRGRGAFHCGAVGDRRRVVEAMDVQAEVGLADETFGEAGGVAAGGLEVRAEGGRADGRVPVDLFKERLFEVEGAGHGRQTPGGTFGRPSERAGAQAEGHGGVEADVDTREDHVGLHGQQVAEGDIHVIIRSTMFYQFDDYI